MSSGIVLPSQEASDAKDEEQGTFRVRRTEILILLFPTVLADIIDFYLSPPTIFSLGLRFSDGPINIRLSYRLDSLRIVGDSKEMETKNLDSKITDAILNQLHGDELGSYTLSDQGYEYDTETNLFLISALIEDPALTVFKSLETNYDNESCADCLGRPIQIGSNRCVWCFTESLDFEIDPTVLVEMEQKRSDVEIEDVDEEINGEISAGNVLYGFRLALVECVFEGSKKQ